MATATPDDVDLEQGGVIATDLTDAQIQGYIDDAAYEAAQAIQNYADKDTEFKTQLEKYLAALRIREIADRSIQNTSRETASVSYEGMSLSALRREVDKRDPTGTLATQRNTDRYTGSTNR